MNKILTTEEEFKKRLDDEMKFNKHFLWISVFCFVLFFVFVVFYGCGGNTSKRLCNNLKDLNKDYEKVYSIALAIKEADPNKIPGDFEDFINSTITTREILLTFEDYVCGLED